MKIRLQVFNQSSLVALDLKSELIEEAGVEKSGDDDLVTSVTHPVQEFLDDAAAQTPTAVIL